MSTTPLSFFRAPAVLGIVALLAAAGPGRAQVTFSNNAGITINDNAPATPYPSNITVSGYAGTISNRSPTAP